MAELTSSATVDEQTINKLGAAYERTRYGNEEIDDALIEEIRLLIWRK